MLPYLFPSTPDRSDARTAPPVSRVASPLAGVVRQVVDLLSPRPMSNLSDAQLSDHRWAIECAIRRSVLGGEHAARAAEVAPALAHIEREMRRRGLL